MPPFRVLVWESLWHSVPETGVKGTRHYRRERMICGNKTNKSMKPISENQQYYLTSDNTRTSFFILLILTFVPVAWQLAV